MMVQDPVCGMRFAKDRSVVEIDYGDKTYYFCTEHCRDVFERDPDRFVTSDADAWETTNGTP